MDCKYQILIMYIKQLTISDYRFGNIDLQIYRKIDNQFFLNILCRYTLICTFALKSGLFIIASNQIYINLDLLKKKKNK